MAQQLINIGATANDRTGDTWRDAMDKSNDNFSELYNYVPDKIIYINEEADFPVQDATTITLQTGFKYFITGVVNTAKTFTVQNLVIMEGISQVVNTLNYTGVGVMFNVQGSFNIFNLNYTCTNGTIFSATTPNFVIMRNSACSSCTNIGTFNTAGVFLESSSFTLVTGQGFVMQGVSSGIIFNTTQVITNNSAFIGVNLGTATMSLFRMQDSTFIGPASSVAINGLTASGNINSGARATVNICNLAGNAMTPLSGVSVNDNRWFFDRVVGLSDSRNAADAYLTTTETVAVAAASTFYEVGGVNWASTIQDRFETGTDGVIIYNGEVPINIKISGFATVAKVGGGADEVEVRFGKNWVSGGGLIQSGGTTQNSNPTSVPLEALTSLVNGDDIRMLVANNGSTADIDVSRASIVVVEA